MKIKHNISAYSYCGVKMKIVLAFLTSFLCINSIHAGELAFDKCKEQIVSSRPYGEKAIVKHVPPTSKGDVVEYYWSGINGNLYATQPNFGLSPTVGLCQFNNKKNKVTRLMIYGDYIITDKKKLLAQIAKIQKPITKDNKSKIANSLGLSLKELIVISKYGKSSSYHASKRYLTYLKTLKDKDWIVLDISSNNGNRGNPVTHPTDISKALHAKLR